MQQAVDLVNALENGIQDFIRNVKYYPDNEVYIPDVKGETRIQRFAKGLGIGHQEGTKNLKLSETAAGGYRKHTMHSPDPSVKHIGYARAFYEPIPDTAYAPLRNLWNPSEISTAPRQLTLTDIDVPNVNPNQLNLNAFKDTDISQLDPEHDMASLLGYSAGRLTSDVMGHGLRKLFWNLNPEDASGTLMGLAVADPKSLEKIGLQPSTGLSNAVRFGTAAGLGMAIGNWNPLNLAEGGRPAGYEAITPGDDPRQSTQPVLDLLVSRGLLGRGGRLLPWDKFREEMPEVSYDQYQKYQTYLFNRDPGILSRATLGLVKGTPEGIDGESPELRVLGYRVTPEGIVGAGIGAAIPLSVAKYISGVKPAEALVDGASKAIRSI